MFIQQLLSARPPECGCQGEKATDSALRELTVAEEQDAEADVAEARTGRSGRTEEGGGRREGGGRGRMEEEGGRGQRGEGLPAQPGQ